MRKIFTNEYFNENGFFANIFISQPMKFLLTSVGCLRIMHGIVGNGMSKI